jgi:hypothetical protein
MDDPSALEDRAAAQFDTGRPDRPQACPAGGIASGFTPFDPPFLEDPYAFLARALREEPVFYSPDIDYWVVTRYDDVRDIFQNSAAWSAAITLSAVTPLSSQALHKLRESGFRMNPVLTNLDPPEHARIRKHATNAFSTRHVGPLSLGFATMRTSSSIGFSRRLRGPTVSVTPIWSANSPTICPLWSACASWECPTTVWPM